MEGELGGEERGGIRCSRFESEIREGVRVVSVREAAC